MAKADLGTKRICPDTGRKFYDLNKTPVISPYTGKVVPVAPIPTRARPEQAARQASVEEAEAVAPEAADIELVSLDAAFIEEEEEGDADVSDIIGESVEKEEEQ
jgi:uncharacterized protein (TIGR02300 family)